MFNEAISRRNLLRIGGLGALAVGASGSLLACSPQGGGSGGSSSLAFWDMPWANASYTDEAKKLVTSTYKDANGSNWTYQQIQWNHFYQTYQTSIASRTNPAVSTGGGFQAVGLASEGGIHYADKVVEALKKSGKIDDFIDGIIESQKVDEGYLGIPWVVDITTVYYLKSVHDENGLTIPKTWDDLYNNGLALKKKGISALITGSGAGNDRGHQTLASLMINNGGGLFNEGGELDVLYERNVEAVEFLYSMVKEGMIAPESVNYTQDNMDTVWKGKKGAVGYNPPNYSKRIPELAGDMLVLSPLKGPHGDTGALRFINSIMMYENNPDKEASERFVEWYATNNATFWTKNLGVSLPVRKSVLEDPSQAKDAEQQKIIDEYLPIGKGLYSRSDKQFANVALIDGSQTFYKFAQTVLSGQGDAKSALSTFQDDLAKTIKAG